MKPMNLTNEFAAGAAALARGEAEQARELFLGIVATGRADSAVLLGLARACQKLDDHAGKIAAIDRLLTADPTNPQALIWKADHFAALGDLRSASSFYLAALKHAPPAAQVATEFA